MDGAGDSGGDSHKSESQASSKYSSPAAPVQVPAVAVHPSTTSDLDNAQQEPDAELGRNLSHSTSPLDRSIDSFKRLRRSSPPPSSTGDIDAEETQEDSASEIDHQSSTPEPSSSNPFALDRSRFPFRARLKGLLSRSASGSSLGRHRSKLQNLNLGDNETGSTDSFEDAIMSEAPRSVAKAATAEPPSLEEQVRLIEEANSKSLVAGDVWYIIGAAWYKSWKDGPAAAGRKEDDAMLTSSPTPGGEKGLGPIDSSDLLDEQTLGLKINIMENIDYELLHKEAWEKLSSWYGALHPVFERTVIPGTGPGAERIEFRPPVIVLLPVIQQNASQTRPPPKVDTSISTKLLAFKTKVKTALSLPESLPGTSIRFWRLPEGADQSAALTAAQLKQPGYELVDENLAKADGDDPTLEVLQLDLPLIALAVEVKSSTDKWPTEEVPVAPSAKGFFATNTEDHWSRIQGQQRPAATADASGPSSATSSRLTRSQTAHERLGAGARTRGLLGLQNLGNTCFMNSALQCMSNTVELQQYFVSGVYKSELNTDNPLGMGGALAEAFGNLLERLWSANGHGAVVPREFKYAVSRFAPQFAGYGQQDTQELLAFLLDGLHEDLNRILKKPYIEAPDWEGGGEKEMVEFARKQWEIYKARNDSVIVDLFQGQYRSTLVCPKCSKVSIKFDPFMYLTLPIPNRRMWFGQVIFVPYDSRKAPIKVDLALPQDATFTKLKDKLGDLFSVDPEKLVGAEVWHGNIHKWYHDWEGVNEIGRQDTAYFWELPVEFQYPQIRGHSLYSRSSMQHPEIYEKTSEPPTGDDWAVLIVFAQIDDQPHRRRVRTTTAGVPFMIAIPPQAKNDPEALRSLLDEQFIRFSQNKDTFVEDVRQGKWHSESEAQEVDMELSAVPNHANTQPTEIVTEIIFKEGQKEPEIVESSQPDEDMVDSALGPIPPSLPEVREIKVPEEQQGAKAPAYIIHFAARKLTAPLPQSGDSWDDESEPIDGRIERLRKEAEEGKSWPLLYTGGGLVCVWNADAAESLLTKSSNDEWGDYETLKDESVAQAKDKGAQKRRLSIEDCMDEFTKKEQLGSDDLWYCPSCKEFRQATKKFDLWKVPDILVVHLKRFSSGRYSRDKLDDFVDFPIEGLDLSKRVEGSKVVHRLESQGYELPVSTSRAQTPEVDADANDDAVAVDTPIYDLYAVDNHYGGLGGGHYTAYAKNHQDGNWYYFDDSSVRKVEAESCKTAAAYLLFYRRRTGRHIGGKTRKKLDESLSSLPDNDAPGAGNTDPPQPPGGFPEADASEDPWDEPEDGYGFNAPSTHLPLGMEQPLSDDGAIADEDGSPLELDSSSATSSDEVFTRAGHASEDGELSQEFLSSAKPHPWLDSGMRYRGSMDASIQEV